MISQRKIKYETHNHSTLDAVKKEIEINNNNNNNKEMKNRFNHIGKFVNALDDHGFKDIPSISQDLRKIGVRREAFSNFIKFCNVDNDKDITKRIQQKSNSCDLNIIFTALCLRNPDLICKKLSDFIYNLGSVKDKEAFKQEISDKIKYILTMKKNKDLSNINKSLTNDKENCSNGFNVYDDTNDVIQFFEECDSEMQNSFWEPNLFDFCS